MTSLVLGIAAIALIMGACAWIVENVRIHRLTKEEKLDQYHRRAYEAWERTRDWHDGR